MGHITNLFAILLACCYLASSAFAASLSTTATAAPMPTSSPTGGDMTKPKPLDGVTLEAVETYAEPRANEIGLGVGIYPFDAYYYGVSLNAGFTMHFSRNFAWEIINAQYFFGFQKDLTTELADVYSVNPTSIPELNYIVSTNGLYSFSYGKSVLFEDFIRYFRDSFIYGLGAVKTTDSTSFAVNLGLKVEMFTTENFSWHFEARDSVAFSGNNYLTFSLGTGLSF
jgi:outer membrane beta-barrel protein